MFHNVRRDLERAMRDPMRRGRLHLLRVLLHPGTQAVLTYRFSHWVLGRGLLLRVLLKPLAWVAEAVMAHFHQIIIPAGAEIGAGMIIHYWPGGICLPRCKIGQNLTIIGGGVVWDYYAVEIGDDVSMGAGMKAVGKIRIGDRVRIAPNTVVVRDVPPDSLVFGNPARVIRGASLWAGAQKSRRRSAPAADAQISEGPSVAAGPDRPSEAPD